MKKKIVVVGAGVIGLHCAYYLAESGHEVEIIDQISEDDEQGCSYGNCGFIVPSHFIPMASPAMLKSGFKMTFNRKSPVQLSPLKNIAHTQWFLNFLKSASAKKVRAAAPSLYQLNIDSYFLYLQFYKDNAENHNPLNNKGLLILSSTYKGFEEEVEVAKFGQSLGSQIDILTNDGLKKHEPNLEFNVEGGVFYHNDGMISPEHHMHLLKTRLKAMNVKFHYNQTVKDFTTSNGIVTQIVTNHTTYKADEFIFTTGANSQSLARKIGLYLPVIAGKGYSVDFSNKELSINSPIILSEAKVAISPFEQKIRLGSGMEFNGKKGHVSAVRVASVLEKTKEAIPSFASVMNEKPAIWEGLRPVSPDGLPFIGRTKKAKNVLFAAGHAMMGVSLGPISGRLIADEINKNKINQSYTALLNPDRFN